MHRKTCLSGAPPSTPLQKLTTLPRTPRTDCERDSPPNTTPLTPSAPRTFKLRPPPLTCSTAVILADECVRRGYSEIDVFCIWLWRIIHFKSELQLMHVIRQTSARCNVSDVPRCQEHCEKWRMAARKKYKSLEHRLLHICGSTFRTAIRPSIDIVLHLHTEYSTTAFNRCIQLRTLFVGRGEYLRFYAGLPDGCGE